MVDKKILEQVFKSPASILDKHHGGMMNESYIVSCLGKKYVLYIPTKQANEMVNRQFEKDNIDIISPLNITSKNVYFDVLKGIKANEYIEGKSLNFISPSEFNYDKIATLLHKLHDSKLRASFSYNPFERLSSFINERKEITSHIDLKADDLYEFVLGYKEYLLNDEITICHNDFQRSNIIKTPDGEYLMIDFEFMADNYPIYDIACFANNEISEGENLLKVYFNNQPTNEHYKRFYLWRIFISLQWYNVALIKHYRGEGKAHNINFLDVAALFLENAKKAKKLYSEIK